MSPTPPLEGTQPHAAVPSSNDSPLSLDLPDLSRTGNSYKEYIEKELIRVIGALGGRSNRGGDTTSTPSNEDLQVRLDSLLNWLETCPDIPPDLKRTKISPALERVFFPAYVRSQMYFSENFKDRAAAMHQRFADEDTDKDLVVEDDGETEDSATETPTSSATPAASVLKRKRSSATAAADAQHSVRIRLPPLNHPIFGRKGIMKGVAIKRGGRKSYLVNPQYMRDKRRTAVLGDNGLAVGDWWPLQVVALFNGAHGSMMGGISGSKSKGAISIVVSGTYEDLDRDEGDILYYSGSGSHENTDPNNIPKTTARTKLLHTSLKTGHPVRVLRSGKEASAWAPSVGIRYDGLYRVVSYGRPVNLRGGLYEQFRLERLPNQRDLTDLSDVPSFEQRQLFEKVKEGY
jgi:hypothetical protein